MEIILNKFQNLRCKSLFPTRQIKNIKTNVAELDTLIGGGIPQGNILELVGAPDTGKTKLIFDIIEKSKDQEMIIAYIATSTKSLAFLEARRLKDNSNLILYISNDEENIINYIKETINIVDLYIIDSIAEIVTINEKDGFDLNENQNMPKLMSILNGLLYGEKSALIAVNYITFKDNKEVSRWRNIFEQYCSIRVELDEMNQCKLLSHKHNPSLVRKEVKTNELRMG